MFPVRENDISLVGLGGRVGLREEGFTATERGRVSGELWGKGKKGLTG